MIHLQLSQITISGFRNFHKSTVLSFLDPYTGMTNSRIILVGTNASGKSTILEVVASLIKGSKSIKDDLFTELVQTRAHVSLEFADSDDNNLAITLNDGHLTISGDPNLIPYYLYFPAERYLLEVHEQPKETLFGYKYHPQEDSPELYLQKGIPHLPSLFFENRTLEYVENHYTLSASATNNTPIPLRKLPAGEKQALILLTLIEKHLKPNSLVIIDEFEISLHPTLQRRLYHLISNYLKKHNCQLLIATHSLEIVRASSDTEVFSLDSLCGGEH